MPGDARGAAALDKSAAAFFVPDYEIPLVRSPP